MKTYLTLVLLLLSGLVQAAVDTNRFVQLIDYIGVDYPGAVAKGQIISAAEYEEMREFAATVESQARELNAGAKHNELVAQAGKLKSLIEHRADPTEVASMTSLMRQSVMADFDLAVVPRSTPDLAYGKQLYMDNCASCHGENGHGDGLMAKGLEPAPTDFHDVARYRDRTLHGLYSTISLGVEGTAMQSYATRLGERDRWALAFYVGQLAVSPAEKQSGEALWDTMEKSTPLAELKTLTTLTPNEAAKRFGEKGLAMMAFLRSEPGVLFANQQDPLNFARDNIAASLASYQAGKRDDAYRQALSAYLDGFELMEHSVETLDRKLKSDIEMAMTNYRELIKHSAEVSQVETQAAAVTEMLDRSEELMGSRTLSGGAAFSGALIILLREGLEALLVIAALAAFLIKTERRDAMLYLHIGWIGALLLGGLTWLASQTLVSFSGASREITEGVAALIAMVVLFWVGFWLHSKTSAAQWKRFIEGSIHKALSTGTLWGIAALSFIAVYREVFETILFYQAMWVQAAGAAKASMLFGMGTAAGVLVLLAWLILRYSARLPLRQFFSFTSVFMFVLAIVFAGKGVAALQEAGKLPVDPISFPRIDILGIYPNMEGLGLQLALLILALIVYFGFSRKQAATVSN